MTRLPARYRVLGTLGYGAAGKVLRVNDQATGRDLALKVVGPAEASWLRREFNTLRQIRHENLVEVLDWGVLDSGDSYYTMELVGGSDLSSRMTGPLPASDLAKILSGILRGIGHLHSHSEVHGDLKPSNVLLDAGDVVKVADVGMGRTAGGAPTASGTPGYTAPEIWAAERATERSDIYSIGVIAYEALAGRHPFEGRTIREVISGQMEGWIPSPSALGVRTQPELERAIMRALERDPSLRQGSSDELADDLGLGRQIGRILGGGFANRADELDHLKRFAINAAQNAPTILYLVGPSGMGKTALVKEARASGLGPTIGELGHPESYLSGSSIKPVGEGSLGDATFSSTSVSEIVTAMIAHFNGAATILIEDPISEGELVRSLGRYIWAEAAERRTAASVRFVRLALSAPDSLEPFEEVLSLPPLDAAQVGELIAGVLGRGTPDRRFLERMVTETGGVPASVTSSLLQLVDAGLVRRHFGRWEFGEISEADWESLDTSKSGHERDWIGFSNSERSALIALGLVKSGMEVADLAAVLPTVDLDSTLSRLKAFGWVETAGPRATLVSREIARAVTANGEPERVAKIRNVILEVLEHKLDRADRATLALGGLPNRAAVEEGLWLGDLLRTRREHNEAARVFAATRRIALNLGDMDSARIAALQGADVLFRSGEYRKGAATISEGEEWAQSVLSNELASDRFMLLGALSKALGEIDQAQDYFSKCSAASVGWNTRRMLRAECELVELQWRHGGETGRKQSAARIEALTADPMFSQEFPDEIAALKYQLGASLVVEGRRELAITVLTDAQRLATSDYWRMRISNALAAAHYYLGDFRPGIAAADIAWQYAVEGQIDSFKPRILASRATLKSALGLFRESLEENRLAASWGLRMGNPFDYETSLMSQVTDLLRLAEYEQGIAVVREARQLAIKVKNGRDVSKSYEMEGLMSLHIGDYPAASDLFLQARRSLEGSGFSDLVPRLCWHEAKIAIERSDFRDAEAKLAEALEVLRETRDYEDLSGVEIEMQVLFARAGDQRLNFEEVRRLFHYALSHEHGVALLPAAIAVGEIARLVSEYDRGTLEMLLDGLRAAERGGADECAWRLSYYIAILSRGLGETKASVTRMANAVRICREVASRLSPSHRSSYLATSHARLLLSEAGGARDSYSSHPKS